MTSAATGMAPAIRRPTKLRESRGERSPAVDLLRGIVILLMVVDHVRYFLSDARFDPTDPVRTTVALFFTRWVTHFCAPVFMLLAGVGAYLSLGRGRDPAALSRFLLVRGIWLVVLELTLARLGWMFNLDYHYTSALVLWALGWCMVALAGLVWLPRTAVAVVAAAMIAGHNLLDQLSPASWGGWGWLWTVLHVPGPINLGAGFRFDVWYPLVPWIGVMAGGFALGPSFAAMPARRDRVLLTAGVAMTLGFVVLRALDAYGDPSRWMPQTTPVRTLLSFLNTTKYPPSLLFVLMTVGPALASVPLLDRLRGPLAEAARTIGRVPLFFWLLHVPLIHAIAVGLSVAQYGMVAPWLIRNPPTPAPSDYGYGLLAVYGVSVAVVGSLYPACRWFAGLKRRRRDAWLSYL